MSKRILNVVTSSELEKQISMVDDEIKELKDERKLLNLMLKQVTRYEVPQANETKEITKAVHKDSRQSTP